MYLEVIGRPGDRRVGDQARQGVSRTLSGRLYIGPSGRGMQGITAMVDSTPHLHRERPRERDWYSIRLAVHSGATSAGRKTMTTPKAKLAGLALIAALCAGFTLGLTAPAWAGLD